MGPTPFKHSASPEITTIIPTYRRPQLLGRAARSAAVQQGVRVLVRICDNASGDATPQVARELATEGHALEYISRDKNMGAVANYVASVDDIRTPFFSLLADDDYLLPGFYQRALTALRANPQAMFWVGTTLNVSPEGQIWDARMEQWPRDGIYCGIEGVMLMTGGGAPNWTAMVFRTEILRASGFIDPSIGGPSDLDFTLRMAALHTFIVERVPVAVSTLNPESFSATKPLRAFWPGWQIMMGKARTLPGLEPDQAQTLLAALRVDARRMLFRRGINALAKGRVEFAHDAAEELRQLGRLRARILSILASASQRFPWVQRGIASSYGWAERAIVRRRRKLQVRHGHLLKDPPRASAVEK